MSTSLTKGIRVRLKAPSCTRENRDDDGEDEDSSLYLRDPSTVCVSREETEKRSVENGSLYGNVERGYGNVDTTTMKISGESSHAPLETIRDRLSRDRRYSRSKRRAVRKVCQWRHVVYALIARGYVIPLYGRGMVSRPSTLWLARMKTCASRLRDVRNAFAFVRCNGVCNNGIALNFHTRARARARVQFGPVRVTGLFIATIYYGSLLSANDLRLATESPSTSTRRRRRRRRRRRVDPTTREHGLRARRGNLENREWKSLRNAV